MSTAAPDYILPPDWLAELMELLAEARVEIQNLSDPANPVARRVAEMEERLSNG